MQWLISLWFKHNVTSRNLYSINDHRTYGLLLCRRINISNRKEYPRTHHKQKMLGVVDKTWHDMKPHTDILLTCMNQSDADAQADNSLHTKLPPNRMVYATICDEMIDHSNTSNTLRKTKTHRTRRGTNIYSQQHDTSSRWWWLMALKYFKYVMHEMVSHEWRNQSVGISPDKWSMAWSVKDAGNHQSGERELAWAATWPTNTRVMIIIQQANVKNARFSSVHSIKAYHDVRQMKLQLKNNQTHFSNEIYMFR